MGAPTTHGGSAPRQTDLASTVPGSKPEPKSFVDTVFGTASERTAEAQRVADATADCMRKLGWQYQSFKVRPVEDHDPTNDYRLDNFAEQYGYGILNARPFSAAQQSAINTPDPNIEYKQSLNSQDQGQFQKDLYGQLPAGPPNPNTQPTGCANKALAQSQGPTVYLSDPTIQSQLGAVQLSIAHDQRMVSATAGWSKCMSSRGFEYPDSASAQFAIRQLGEHRPSDDADFEPTLARERSTATADRDCYNEYMKDIESTVTAEAEKAFLEGYKPKG